MQTFSKNIAALAASCLVGIAATAADAPRPYREIGATLGPRANSHHFLLYRGAAIFDANGDGRLDLYLPHTGRPVLKATDASGAVTRETVPALPSVLFLNQGNDSDGNPKLVSVQDLAADNTDHVREELLIENKYVPRESTDDDEFGVGRCGVGAVAADFNGDGRLDLYVLNSYDGVPFSHAETAWPVYPAGDNLGRVERRTEPVRVQTPPFLAAPVKDGLNNPVPFGDGKEYEGQNVLYLNLGDSDGDGIPEWKDVTADAGVGGRYGSTSASVADVDRDGDLDIYVANFGDPDHWGFGMSGFSGHANQLYINQFVETGELRFIEQAEAFGVSGLHDAEDLPATITFPDGTVAYTGEQKVDGKTVGQRADHSWSAKLADFNDDGWPDLVVGNDVGNRLRVYMNREGKRFERLTQFDDEYWNGCWMGIESGDFDGDLRDDLLLANCGSQTMSIRNTALLIDSGRSESSIGAASVMNYAAGRANFHHTLLQFQPEDGLVDSTRDVRVAHAKRIPPDMTRPENVPASNRALFERERFADGLAGIEFSWGPAVFDVDNDGDLDAYLLGALGRGNDNFIGDWSGSPGRMLVNESRPGKPAFRDATLDYRLLDVQDMDYDHDPPQRTSPGTNWHKRDYVRIDDLDSYSEAGIEASRNSTVHDIFRMHECASGYIAGDLNGDGWPDIVVTHDAGYNSNLPSARNLKARLPDGQAMAVPGLHPLLKPPTNFEPGPTFLYIHGGSAAENPPNWIRLKLTDAESPNRFAVGAKVIVNGKILRRVTIGGPTFSAYTGDLLIGLGDEPLREVEIVWPQGADPISKHRFDPPRTRETVEILRP